MSGHPRLIQAILHMTQSSPLRPKWAKISRGTKFLNDSNVYHSVDYWHFDNKEMADFASVWATSPWEVNAAIEIGKKWNLCILDRSNCQRH